MKKQTKEQRIEELEYVFSMYEKTRIVLESQDIEDLTSQPRSLHPETSCLGCR